jgi:hypothetical protein
MNSMHRHTSMPERMRYDAVVGRGVICAAVFLWSFEQPETIQQDVQLNTATRRRYRGRLSLDP